MKLSNSFMDVIYFCFLSSNADSKFWDILFKGRYSKFLKKRFNSSEFNEEVDYDFDYDFEDVYKKLKELLFDVKNNREENSYELLLEFIYSIKIKKGIGDISLEDFFKLLKTESVYFDRLIKNKLKLFKLRINTPEGNKKPEKEIQFNNYINKILPEDIDNNSVDLLFSNKGKIGKFDLKTDDGKEDFFNKLDTIISTETGLNIEDIKKRRSNQGDYLKYNIEFLEKYLIEYFNGFALHNINKLKYQIVKKENAGTEGGEVESTSIIKRANRAGKRRAFFQSIKRILNSNKLPRFKLNGLLKAIKRQNKKGTGKKGKSKKGPRDRRASENEYRTGPELESGPESGTEIGTEIGTGPESKLNWT